MIYGRGTVRNTLARTTLPSTPRYMPPRKPTSPGKIISCSQEWLDFFLSNSSIGVRSSLRDPANLFRMHFNMTTRNAGQLTTLFLRSANFTATTSSACVRPVSFVHHSISQFLRSSDNHHSVPHTLLASFKRFLRHVGRKDRGLYRS